MNWKRFLLIAALSAAAWAQAPASKEVEAVYPEARALYLDIHQNPELSSHEVQTAAKLAGRLRGLGYEVTEHVGGTGIVAILKNGAGPTVMLRTELDALPVEEKTGLAYASKVHTKDDAGHDRGDGCGDGAQQEHLARDFDAGWTAGGGDDQRRQEDA
jgi:hypothetical protein